MIDNLEQFSNRIVLILALAIVARYVTTKPTKFEQGKEEKKEKKKKKKKMKKGRKKSSPLVGHLH